MSRSIEKQQIEAARRERLKKEKPLAFEKILKIADRFKAGLATPVVDIGFNLACNLKCRHCFTTRFAHKERALSPDDLRRFSDEAHELGLCQFVISGGEPLILKNLQSVIKALQPDRFHLSMSTNGYFLTKEMARDLRSWGLDKVKISIDDFDAAKHDMNRNKEGAYLKAKEALFNAQEAGLSVVIQTCITHQNCRTDRTLEMAKFAQENGFTVDVMIAHAVGEWEGKHDMLIDADDAAYMKHVNQQYPSLHRDTFPTYGIERGCGSVNSNLHLTQYGDILPCGFIHISLGNIFEESFAAILKRGMSIKHFKEFNPLCLSGEDSNFIKNYMSKFYGKPLPVHWSEVFTPEDFV
ncbi:MAG: radical SAM protein [Candidatus Omnitrophica bacterium]|nr:radical SAM protein [Candidatus Omnitrophota bacterium]